VDYIVPLKPVYNGWSWRWDGDLAVAAIMMVVLGPCVSTLSSASFLILAFSRGAKLVWQFVWAFFPQTACPQSRVLTVRIKAGA